METILTPEELQVLAKIPILKYLQEPVDALFDLYERFPDGGEKGFYALVGDKGTFAYWSISTSTWELLNTEAFYNKMEINSKERALNTTITNKTNILDNKIDNINSLNLWIPKDAVALKTHLVTAYPTAQKNWAAMVLDDGFIYVNDGLGVLIENWVNSGQKAFPEDVLTKQSAVIKNIDLSIQSKFRLNGYSSYIKVENANPITNLDGIYEMYFKMPEDLESIQILFCFGNKIMLALNETQFAFYYSDSGGLVDTYSSDGYAGKKIKVSLVKTDDNIDFYIDGEIKKSFTIGTITTADTTCHIGSFEGTALFSKIELYYFRVLDQYNNVLTNVDTQLEGLIAVDCEKLISNTRYSVAKQTSLILNGTSSYINIKGNNIVTPNPETYQILFKVPLDTEANQAIIAGGVGSLYVGIFMDKIYIVKQGIGNIFDYYISNYREREILLTIVKKDVGFDAYIGATKLVAHTDYGQRDLLKSDEILIGAYDGNIINAAIEFKLFRKWNSELTEEEIAFIAEDFINNIPSEDTIYLSFENAGIATNGLDDYRGNAIGRHFNCILKNPNRPVSFNSATTGSSILQHLPSSMDVCTLTELNIWLDNIIQDYENTPYRVEAHISGTSVRNMNRAIRMNFNTTGAKSVDINVYNSEQDIVETKTITVNVTSITAGTSTKQFLFVGDSTIDDALLNNNGSPYYDHVGPAIVQEFYTLSDNNKGYTPLLIGHQKNYPPYYHAGIKGWASSDFLNSNSPFWNVDKNDFKNYVQTNIVGQAGAIDNVDFMIYQIGINDLKNQQSPESVIANIKTFIDQFLVDYPSAKIIIGYPASGCDETGFSCHFYASTSFIKFRKDMKNLWKLIYTEFENGLYSENVYTCNAGQWIDRVYGFPYKLEAISGRNTETQLTHWDSVHPNESGYKQMADAYFSKIKTII